MISCLACGAELVQPARGRRRRFCSVLCRQRDNRVTKCEGYPEVPPTPRVPPQRVPVRSFATFGELDQWLEANL